MGGTASPEPNGWLREYLDSSFGQVRCDIRDLKADMSALRERMAAMETGERNTRRLWQAVRDWASPFVTALVGAWAVWRGSR